MWNQTNAALIESIRAQKEQSIADQKQAETHKENWCSPSVIVQGVLAVIGFGYLGFMGLQWKAIKKQAKIASKTLLLQFRPHLIVRNVVLTEVTERPSGESYMLRRGYHVVGQFYAANIGGSDATITESFCMIEWRSGGLPMRRPYEGQAGNNPVSGVLRPGKSTTGVFTSAQPLDVDPQDIFDPRAIGDATPRHLLSLYVMGWIAYADDLGFVRRTAFCRWLSPIRGHFVPADNPDYEHEE